MFKGKITLPKITLPKYAQEIGAVVLVAIALFLTVSLLSYHPHDQSWFFQSSELGVVRNVCGIAGAHVAALLFYMLGASSLFLVGMLLFVGIHLLMRTSFIHEWDRMLAVVLLMVTASGFSSLYGVDFLRSPYPGGFVGRAFQSNLHYTFGDVGSIIFLHMLLLISFVVITRFSFIGLVQYAAAGVRFVHAKQWFVPPVYRLVRSVAAGAVAPLAWAGKTTQKLFSTESLEKDYSVADFDQELMEVETPEPQQLFSEQSASSLTIGQLQQKMLVEQEAEESVEKDLPDDASWYQSSGELDKTSEQAENPHAPSSSVEATQGESSEQASDEVQSAKSVRLQKSYELPSLDIFIGVNDERDDDGLLKSLEVRAKILEEKLERFGVKGSVVSIKRGPVVTLFEYQPEIDTKLSKILALEDDLALALQALSIRIIAPIPGKPVVGFEVANKKRRMVPLSSVIQSSEYENFDGDLPLVLGEDTVGNNVFVDLAKMPHLLIAGSTGSGKSVALNAMLVSLLCKCTPDELKLILIDPKRLEFAAYADIAHLLFPIIIDPRKAAPILQWVVQQMEERYERMAEVGARSLDDYNEWAKGEPDEEPLPKIVVVIDELADLMMTAGKTIEDLIARIAQMARAAGIHMILATQRPSVDVITGLIKVNFPSRISFKVTSKVDSRTILDSSGAEKLLGKGDMLFLDAGGSAMRRVHGAFVSDEEIQDLVEHIQDERRVKYLNIHEELVSNDNDDLSEADDELYQGVMEFLQEVDEVSISLLQRKFRIGYNRSARIIDKLESQGIIMPADGGKTRKVIR